MARSWRPHAPSSISNSFPCRRLAFLPHAQPCKHVKGSVKGLRVTGCDRRRGTTEGNSIGAGGVCAIARSARLLVVQRLRAGASGQRGDLWAHLWRRPVGLRCHLRPACRDTVARPAPARALLVSHSSCGHENAARAGPAHVRLCAGPHHALLRVPAFTSELCCCQVPFKGCCYSALAPQCCNDAWRIAAR